MNPCIFHYFQLRNSARLYLQVVAFIPFLCALADWMWWKHFVGKSCLFSHHLAAVTSTLSLFGSFSFLPPRISCIQMKIKRHPFFSLFVKKPVTHLRTMGANCLASIIKAQIWQKLTWKTRQWGDNLFHVPSCWQNSGSIEHHFGGHPTVVQCEVISVCVCTWGYRFNMFPEALTDSHKKT